MFFPITFVCFNCSTACFVAKDFTRTMTRSASPIVSAVVLASTLTYQSSFSFVICRPSLLIRSTCSCHISTKWTSFPPIARVPPIVLPKAPAPNITIFIFRLPVYFSSKGKNFRIWMAKTTISPFWLKISNFEYVLFVSSSILSTVYLQVSVSPKYTGLIKRSLSYP